MMTKAKKRAGRLGCRSVKIHFAVQLQSASLPLGCLVPDQAILSVSFQRKAKSVATGSFIHKIAADEKENIVVINETLEMVTVLFKDTRTGRFQKKTGKLVLRQLSKQGLLGNYSYKILGRCDLNFHQIANELRLETSTHRSGIVVFDNLKGVVLRFTVVATIQSIDSGCQYSVPDDTASEVSDLSDVSEITSNSSTDPPGSFLLFDPPVGPVSGPGATPTGPMGSYLDTSSTTLSGVQMQDRIEEGENERSPAHSAAHSPPLAFVALPGSQLSSPCLSTSTSTSTTATFVRLLSQVTDFSATKHAFLMYDEELRRRGEHVALLERRLAEQSAQSSAQTAALHEELSITSTLLRKEQARSAGQLLERCFTPDEKYTAAAEAAAQLTELHTQVNTLQSELQISRDNEKRLRQALMEEMTVAREAAAVAASSAVLRAEVEDECQMHLSDLIALKLERANMSMALDALLHENTALTTEVKKIRANSVQSARGAATVV